MDDSLYSRRAAPALGSMTVHLVKLCVGADSVADLEDWVNRRVADNRKKGRGALHDHVTRMHPKRADELVDGGSIYWVIKGVIQARQEIKALERITGQDGVQRTAIRLAPKLILTEPQHRRAFQGWRYLKLEDAPRDLGKGGAGAAPPELSAKLAELGLL